MRHESIKMNWELGYPSPGGSGELRWTGAKVPGAVQLDVAEAEGYGPWFYAENWRDYLWMEDCSFIYRSSFARPGLHKNERLYFFSKGIDYTFEIILNGHSLLSQEGMFTPVLLDLTAYLDDANELLVKIFPIPKKQPEPPDRVQASASVKPAVSYGWDWHPRLVPSGIWDETGLEIRPASHMDDVSLQYKLNEQLSSAGVVVEARGSEMKGCMLSFRFLDAEERVLYSDQCLAGAQGANFAFRLEDPRLWWPHDHGHPYLYHYDVELTDPAGKHLQTLTGKQGFRRVKLVMNHGGWDEPTEFPRTRSIVPIQLEINNRQIFCKGTNWVNPEIFPGLINSKRYDELTDRALEANFNLLRVWGGGIVNKQPFHDQCDEKGILVWQEFPLACNNYEDDPRYLEVLKQEAESIIRRIRKHASLALWSGGNELFNSWSGMSDQSLALRMLNSLCLNLDPDTPFISTSPLFGMAHGHYVFRDPESGEEVFSTMNSAANTAYTEFGVPSPSSVEILELVIPPDELWPPAPGASWESHHAYNAWEGDTWLMKDMIDDYFGKAGSLEELVANGQLLQAEGYKAIYEESRRQKPYCSMALNWCFNEPWPTAANNNIVSYPNSCKPAFGAVRNACRPVMASARNFKFSWQEGEDFRTELWMLNDRFQKVEAGVVRAKLISGGSCIELGSWSYECLAANSNQKGPFLRARLPALEADRFTLELEVDGSPAYNSSYTFLYRLAT